MTKEIVPPEEKEISDAEDVFLSWGSSRNAAFEALDRLRENGTRVGAIHFTELLPLPEYEFPRNVNYCTVESNAICMTSRRR